MSQISQSYSSACSDILFTRFHIFTKQKAKKGSKNGNNSAMTSPTEKKKMQVRLFFMFILYILNFKILSRTVLDRMQSTTDAHTNGQALINMTSPKLGA